MRQRNRTSWAVSAVRMAAIFCLAAFTAAATTEQSLLDILRADDAIPNPFAYDGDANGIPELAQFRLLDAVLRNASAPHYLIISSSWALNLVQMQRDNTNQGMCELQALIAGYTCSDVLEAIPGAVTIAEPGMEPWIQSILNTVRITANLNNYNRSAGQYLRATADLDGDTFSNLAEWQAAEGDYEKFVAAAMDPSITPGPIPCLSNCPLEIVQQPQSARLYAGDSYTLSIQVAHIEGSVQYFWYRNSVAMPQRTSTISFSPLKVSDAGSYYCMIVDNRGAYGIATEISATATLVVAERMTIRTPPAGAAIRYGNNHTFRITVTGGLGTLRYTWKRNGIPVGGNSSSLVITNAQVADSGAYTCEISDGVSTIISPTAELLVIQTCYTFPCEQTCTGGGITAGFENAYRTILTNNLVKQDPDTMDADDNLIVDAAQARLVDAVLADTTLPYHCCVRKAYLDNLAVVNAIADKVPSFYFLVIPRDAFVKMSTGLVTVGEEATASVLVNLGAHIPGFPDFDPSAFNRSAEQYLAFNADPDEDGVPNVGEYLAHVSGPEDFDAFVQAAMDFNQREDGGGCEPCDQPMDILLMGDLWPKRAFRWDTLAQVLQDHGYGHYRVAGSISTSQWISATLMAKNENNELGRVDLAFERFPDVQFVQISVGSMDIINLAIEKSLNSMSASALNDALNEIQNSIQTVINYLFMLKPDVEILLADSDYLNPDAIKAAFSQYKLKAVSQRTFNNALVALGRKILEIAQRTPHCHYVQNWGLIQYYMGNPPVWNPEGVPFPGTEETGFQPYPGGNPDYSCPLDAYENQDGYTPTAEVLYWIYDNIFHQFYEKYLIPDGMEGEGAVEGQEEGLIEGEGIIEGQEEGQLEGEGQEEGQAEGEGVIEGQEEGQLEGEGVIEGQSEGEGVAEGQSEGEGIIEGQLEGEGVLEGQPEGVVEGLPEGQIEGQPEGEGLPEGQLEGQPEGQIEGQVEGQPEGEGAPEGQIEGQIEGQPEGEGTPEGQIEGQIEGQPEGEGAPEGQIEGQPEGEGAPEGQIEGQIEGQPEGEGAPEGLPEGQIEGQPEGEGAPEGLPEGQIEGQPEGEGAPEGQIEGQPEGEGLTEGQSEGEGEEGEVDVCALCPLEIRILSPEGDFVTPAGKDTQVNLTSRVAFSSPDCASHQVRVAYSIDGAPVAVSKNRAGNFAASTRLPAREAAYALTARAHDDETGCEAETTLEFFVRPGTDADGNGLLDFPFAALPGDGDRWEADSVLSGARCARFVRMVSWTNPAGADIVLDIARPDNATQSLTITVPRGLISAGEQGVLVASIACDLVSLLGKAEAAKITSEPAFRAAGGAPFQAGILVSNNGGASFHALDTLDLPVTVSLNGLVFSPGMNATFSGFPSDLSNDASDRLEITVPANGEWNSEYVENPRVSTGTLTAETAHLSVFQAIEEPAMGPTLSVSPNPAYDFLVGIVPQDGSITNVLKVKNIGGGVIQGAATIDDPSATFSIVGAANYRLAYGQTAVITVGFTPAKSGDYTAALTLNNTSVTPSQQIVVTLRGSASTKNSKSFSLFGCGPVSPGPGNRSDFLVMAGVLLALCAVRCRKARGSV